MAAAETELRSFCSWGSCANHLVIDKALKVLIVRVVRCDCNQLEWRGWALHVSGSNVKCVLVAEKHYNPGLVAQFERLDFKIFLPLMNTQLCFFPLDAVNSWVLFALNPSVPLSLGYPLVLCCRTVSWKAQCVFNHWILLSIHSPWVQRTMLCLEGCIKLKSIDHLIWSTAN